MKELAHPLHMLPDNATNAVTGSELLAEHAGDDEFLDIARNHADEPGTVILLSGGDHECARRSIIAARPALVVRTRGNIAEITTATGTAEVEGKPLELLDEIIGRFAAVAASASAECPAGLFGYFAYELKNSIEPRLPQRAIDDLHLPEMFLVLPTELTVHDQADGRITGWTIDIPELSPLASPPGANDDTASRQTENTSGLRSTFTREEYCAAVNCIRGAIRAGDVYQINLSQRFSHSLSNPPFDLWRRLYAAAPAPFYAYANAGDHHVLSASMERFLQRDGRLLETRPIKGTRPRGLTPASDEAMRRELLASEKDDAELSMIVDLMRNDLGRICETGSVTVSEHKRLESYASVHHLVSVVRGRLSPDATPGEILAATFPGGSITGCPKFRAMEMIDAIEPVARHVYTGAIGSIGFDGGINLSIAIRTAVCRDGVLHLGAGGGVVYDSEPEHEYEETLHKVHSFLQLLEVSGETKQ